MEELLPEGHLARFIWQVLSALDFIDLEAQYPSIKGGPGRSPYHPRVIAALWIYGMTQGLGKATLIAQACRIRDDFRWLAGGLCPSDETLLNLVRTAPDGLASLWIQVLQAMQREGLVDLSAVAEDGTKLRANVSPRSFHTAKEIDEVIHGLRNEIAEAIKNMADGETRSTDKPHAPMALRMLQNRLQRAEAAAAELSERIRRRSERGTPLGTESGVANINGSLPPRPRRLAVFGRERFRHDTERDVLICPAGQDLRFIGVYSGGADPYRLYGRSNCAGCHLKEQCTGGYKRRVKIPVGPAEPAPSPSGAPPSVQDGTDVVDAQPQPPPASGSSGGDGEQSGGPQASVTEPEAVMMLATSLKRFEPSYNADLTVTRHGVIVNQFLTKEANDFGHFRRALPAVLNTVGRPQSWIGDGHYGTKENLRLADNLGVLLYAPPAAQSVDEQQLATDTAAAVNSSEEEKEAPKIATKKYGRGDFHYQVDRDVMVCPAGNDLRFIGTYPVERGVGEYRLYGRSDCGGCSLKAQCTDGPRRRLKVPVGDLEDVARPDAQHADSATTGRSRDVAPLPAPRLASPPAADVLRVNRLLQALEARMRDVGEGALKFRGATVEPVNAQLKQHGLSRFHVHGLSRCGTILALACLGHNLMKWKALRIVAQQRAQERIHEMRPAA